MRRVWLSAGLFLLIATSVHANVGPIIGGPSSLLDPSPGLRAAGDFTGDGYVDVASHRTQDSLLVIYRGDGHGEFRAHSHRAHVPLSQLVAGDFNGDGISDLLALRIDSGNTPFNQFVDVYPGSIVGLGDPKTNDEGIDARTIVVRELDGDQISDLLLLPRDQGTVRIIKFGAAALPRQVINLERPADVAGRPTALEAADLDGDGLSEVLVTYADGNLAIYRGADDYSAPTVQYVGPNPISIMSVKTNWDNFTNVLVSTRATSDRPSGIEVLRQESGALVPLRFLPTRYDSQSDRFPALLEFIAVADSAGASPRVMFAYDSVEARAWRIQPDDSWGFGRTSWISPPTGRAFAVLDFDGDKVADLATGPGQLPNGRRLSSHLALSGDHAFLGGFPASLYKLQGELGKIAVADLDGDGKDDIVLTIPEFSVVEVVFGGGNCAFESADRDYCFDQSQFLNDRAPTGDIATADFDGDRLPDIAFEDAGSNSVLLVAGAGDRQFQPGQRAEVSLGGCGLLAGDFTGDGIPDLLGLSGESGRASLARGRGNFQFDPPVEFTTGTGECHLIRADVDRDGFPDLVTYGDRISIRWGTSSGLGPDRYVMNTAAPLNALLVADVFEEGHQDLVAWGDSLPSYSSLPWIYIARGNGGRVFGSLVPEVPIGPTSMFVAADVNGDRISDLVFEHGPGAVAIRLGGSRALFYDFSLAVQAPKFLALADLDGDGDPDVLTVDPTRRLLGVQRNVVHRTDPPITTGSETIQLLVSQNPASGHVKFGYRQIVPGGIGPSRLDIHDAGGRLVATMPILSEASPQPRFVIWNGRTRTGDLAPSGIYFARMVVPVFESSSRVLTRRFVWLR